jgi:hypothetical protein
LPAADKLVSDTLVSDTGFAVEAGDKNLRDQIRNM